MKNFMKTKVNQFTQLWARKVYNFKRSKKFLQNFCKNRIFTDTILEKQKYFDIIFI